MLTKQEKQEIVEELADKFSRQKAAVFSDYSGLTTEQIRGLKIKLREQGIDYQVAKKTLIDLALEKAGFKEIKARRLPGQVAVIFGYGDEVAPARLAYNFSKSNKSFKILAALVQGKFLEEEAALSLAKLPSKQELLAKLVGGIAAPLSGIACVLQGNLRKLIYILEAKSRA